MKNLEAFSERNLSFFNYFCKMLNKLASDCYQNVVGFEAEMFLITVISFGFKKAALKKFK